MSASLKGMADLDRFVAEVAQNLEPTSARRAVKAGAEVLADAWRKGVKSPDIAGSIGTTSRSEPGLVSAKARSAGKGSSLALWGEFGTDPHFISVDDERSGGRTIKRINKLTKEGSLVIGGKFVGKTVHHPGARKNPAARDAVDSHQEAAITAVARSLAADLVKGGLGMPVVEEPDE